jgi:hypothetical protein
LSIANGKESASAAFAARLNRSVDKPYYTRPYHELVETKSEPSKIEEEVGGDLEERRSRWES